MQGNESELFESMEMKEASRGSEGGGNSIMSDQAGIIFSKKL